MDHRPTWGITNSDLYLIGIANLLAAIGVIASLVFVGLQVRKSAELEKRANWDRQIDRIISLFKSKGDVSASVIIVKGRQDYLALNQAELLFMVEVMQLSTLGEFELVLPKYIVNLSTFRVYCAVLSLAKVGMVMCALFYLLCSRKALSSMKVW